MKKIMCVILTFLFLLVGLVPNSSAAFADDGKSVKKINELEFAKQLKLKTNTELEKMGFKPDDIKKIKDFDFKEEIKKRSNKYDDNQLKNLGYSDKQIQIMRNYDGSDAQTMALTATVTLSFYKTSSYSSSDYSYLDMYFSYSWDSQPFWALTDVLAFAYSKPYMVKSQSYVTAEYHHTYSGNLIYRTYNVASIATGAGCTFKVPLDLTGSYDYYLSRSGYGKLYLQDYSEIRSAQLKYVYGHSQYGLNADATISSWPTISISASADETEAYYDFTPY